MFGNAIPRKKPTNSHENRNMFLIFIIVVLGLWLSTGFYRVLPEENAIILTFGKWTNTRGEPGLGYVITSYSIHYTKLYDSEICFCI